MVTWLPPSLVEACNDPGMQGIPLEILTRCWGTWLVPHKYTPLPMRCVMIACRVEDITASRTLTYIAESGYIEEGPRQEGGTRTFRVIATRQSIAA